MISLYSFPAISDPQSGTKVNYNRYIRQADVNGNGKADEVYLNNKDDGTFNGASWKDMNPATNPSMLTQRLGIESDERERFFRADAKVVGLGQKGPFDGLQDKFYIESKWYAGLTYGVKVEPVCIVEINQDSTIYNYIIENYNTMDVNDYDLNGTKDTIIEE
jgi:hypothetical protein